MIEPMLQFGLRSFEDLADETNAGGRAVRLKAGIAAAWLGLETWILKRRIDGLKTDQNLPVGSHGWS